MKYPIFLSKAIKQIVITSYFGLQGKKLTCKYQILSLRRKKLSDSFINNVLI